MNELGELRPSQLIFTFGVGALVDLPNFSALILGLDDWDTAHCQEIFEDRLLAAVRQRRGAQVGQFFMPPVAEDDAHRDAGAPAIGVPVAPFPRWMRCSVCNTIATVDSGVFEIRQDRWRPDRTRYVHVGCKNSEPTAFPVRFLVACREGHLTDFPWIEYVHEGRVPCRPAHMRLREFGASGDASDVIAECLTCSASRRMADAFDRTHGFHFSCHSHHPHLRRQDRQACTEQARAILLGASNNWFPITLSALSLPRGVDRLDGLVDDAWIDLAQVQSASDIAFMRRNHARYASLTTLFAEFDDDKVWEGVARRRKGREASQEDIDLKSPEWLTFSNPDTAAESRDFRLRRVKPPTGLEPFFEDTVLVERIREVRALLGFTRIESNADFAEPTRSSDDRRMSPLTREPPRWLPAAEVRGEGIFLRLREDRIQRWESAQEVQRLGDLFLASHREWRIRRNLQPPGDGFPGIRYVLLHSLSHALMRQIALECGYTAASLRERLYCRAPSSGAPMAGILIYTAASDSEGTLGGLVAAGEPVSLGRHLAQAFESIHICASDPLCAEHEPQTDGRAVHGASCHACLFSPETSCESGNRYLDRSTLVETLKGAAAALFGGQHG